MESKSSTQQSSNTDSQPEVQSQPEQSKYTISEVKIKNHIKNLVIYINILKPGKENKFAELAIKQLKKSLLKGGLTEEDFQYRLDNYVEEEDDFLRYSFERGDVNEQITIDTAIANLREILPANVPIQEVQQILHRLHTNGVPTGLVWNKVLYLDKAIKSGTEYHEAFHFVFRYFLTTIQKNALLKSARSKYDKPTAKQLEELRNQTDLRKGFTNKQLSDIYYEELLADGFMEFIMNQGNEKVSGEIEVLFLKIVTGFYKIRRVWN